MRTGKRKKIRICAAVAALCVLSGLVRITSLARTEITEKNSRLTLNVKCEDPEQSYNKPQNDPESQSFGELAEADIEVNLYRVADIDAYGSYTALSGFQELGLEDPDYRETDEKWWKETAEKAAEILGIPFFGGGEQAPEEETVPMVNPDKSLIISGGTGTVEVENGLYLVWAKPMLTDEYRYTFLPYLISLPHNDYAFTGIDRWEHDVTAGLKPRQERRYGDLVVRKKLEEWESGLGTAFFVFEVEARKDLDHDGAAEIVYSNVLSLRFDGTGEKSALAEHIPAGAAVTVREVYSGGSYEVSGSVMETTVINATDKEEGETAAESQEEKPSEVFFANHYNNKVIPATAVVNHFTAGENGWVWEKRPDSERKEEGEK